MLTTFVKLCSLSVLLLAQFALCGWAAMALLRLWTGETAVRANAYLWLFFATGIGLLVDMALLFMLGLCGWLNGAAMLGVGAMVITASIGFLFHLRDTLAFPFPFCRKHVGFIVLAVLLAISIMTSMRAPGYWDDTMYHLPLARFYLQHGGLVVNEFIRFPLFPQNMDLLFTLGLRLNGSLGAQILATLPLFIIAIGLLGVSEWLTGSIIMGALASATLYILGPVKEGLGYAYIDNGLALFSWMAVLALGIWAQTPRESRSRFWVIIAGIAGGGAAGTKYFGLVIVMILVIYILLIRRDWKSVLWFSTAAFAAGSWWYLRSYLISGDPVHPAGGNVFGYYLWDAGDLLFQKHEQALHGVSPWSFDLWSALKTAHVLPWVMAITTLVARRLRADLRCFQFVFLSYLAFWFFVTQVSRYLAPLFAVGTLLSWYAVRLAYSKIMARWSRARGKFNLFLRFFPVSLLTAGLAVLCITHYWKATQTMKDWQISLDRRAGYQLFARANQEIPRLGDRMVQLGFENAVYFFNGITIGDWFGPGRYRNMIESGRVIAPERMKVLMEGFGVRIFAVSTKRYPAFDCAAYARCFDVLMVSDDGILLALKPDHRPVVSGLSSLKTT